MKDSEISCNVKQFIIASLYTQVRSKPNIQFNSILYSTDYDSVVYLLLPSLIKKLKINSKTFEIIHCQILYLFSGIVSITINFSYWINGLEEEDNIINFDFDLDNNITRRLTIRKK